LRVSDLQKVDTFSRDTCKPPRSRRTPLVFTPFLLTLVLASAPADDRLDAVTLIGRLGSESFDDRVAAYKGLERLGGAALPALRAAADTSDMRVRSRVLALIESIGRQVEAERFAQPTIIRLDIRTRPLGEVVDALNDRYDLGLSLRLGPEPERGLMVVDPGGPDRLKELRAREIRTRAARPLPYWEAIDRLCEAGSLRYGVSLRQFGTGRGSLVLMADRTGRGPVSDSGPFRVQITWAHPVFNRDFPIDFVPRRRGAKPPGAGDLTVPLAVLPEPGLMLRRNGPVSITEATDDRGRSLAPRAPAEPDPGPANRSRQATYEGDAIQVNAVLAAPDPPATAIRRLRGKVSVIAVARGSDPIVIPLKGEGVRGRPYSTRDLTLVVDEVSLAPGAPAWVKVTVRDKSGDRATFARHDPPGPPFAGYNRGGVLEHLQLHDADGRRLNHQLGMQMRGADTEGFFDRFQFIVSSRSEDGPGVGPGTSKAPIPSELRYYPFVQTVMEIPFDFRDVPMP
jgi:hypothetical protein